MIKKVVNSSQSGRLELCFEYPDERLLINHHIVPIVWGFQEQDTVSLGYKQMIWLCYAHNIRFMVDDHPSDNENPNPNKNYMNPY